MKKTLLLFLFLLFYFTRTWIKGQLSLSLLNYSIYYYHLLGDIVIASRERGVSVGDDFIFNCSSSDKEEPLYLTINGEFEGDYFNKTSSSIAGPGHVTYTYSNAALNDNGLIFQCITDDNEASAVLPLIIYSRYYIYMYI